ncbi:MAG TPA: glucosamine-6-phosphate deaminase, partial [Treponemataceae bacterium]|nr:glucosamine-6-phosphate deaminase [Treponemataceae bacterium]
YDDCSNWTADYIVNAINTFAPTKKKPFVLGLATGSSPIGTYQKLIELNKANKVSFKHVISFNMDEYVGLPANHKQSYHYFMYEYLFNHIDINPANIHILDGMAKNLEQECLLYEEAIKKAGGIHLFLGGTGCNGHIAFNEIGSSLSSRTRVKSLSKDTIIVNSRFFNGDITRVPKKALTVGVGTICDAEEVLFLVTGHNKALALKHAVEGAVSQMWPISILQMHSKAIIVADNDATDELKVGTLRYFKNIEEIEG